LMSASCCLFVLENKQHSRARAGHGKALSSHTKGILFIYVSFLFSSFPFIFKVTGFYRPVKPSLKVILILVAFITGNSSLEPLIEGLYAQN